MSTTEEEIRALQRAERLLVEIGLNAIPKMPKEVTEKVRSILRHFPGKTALEIYWTKGKK